MRVITLVPLRSIVGQTLPALDGKRQISESQESVRDELL